jgi:hypothetical protein
MEEPRSSGQVHELFVEAIMGGEERRPADFEGDERFHELHGMVDVAGKLAGGEKDVFAATAFYVLHHLGGGAVAISIVTVQPAFGAEIANVGTAPGILDDIRPVENIFLGIQQIPTRRGHS